jgi:hypothetical protein
LIKIQGTTRLKRNMNMAIMRWIERTANKADF